MDKMIVINDVMNKAEGMAFDWFNKTEDSDVVSHLYHKREMVKALIDRCVVYLVYDRGCYYARLNASSALKYILRKLHIHRLDDMAIKLLSKEWEYAYYIIHKKIRDGAL